jgi:hypothetical protein
MSNFLIDVFDLARFFTASAVHIPIPSSASMFQMDCGRNRPFWDVSDRADGPRKPVNAVKKSKPPQNFWIVI